MNEHCRDAGCVLGTVYVHMAGPLATDQQRAALCDTKGKFGLYLRDPQPLAEPVPAKGQQGIWHIERSALGLEGGDE